MVSNLNLLNTEDTSMFQLITSAFNALPDLIYIMEVNEQNAVYRFANHSALSILGDQTMIVGKTFEDIFPTKRARFLKQFYIKAAHNNRIVTFEEEIDVHDKHINFETVLTPVKNSESVYIIAVVRDITERTLRTQELIKTNQQLEKNKQRLSSLVENNTDGVFMLDIDGYFLEANAAFETIIGYHLFDLVGTSFAQITSIKELTKINGLFHQVIDGETINYETIVIKKDGREVYMDIKFIPIIVEGRTIVVYGIAKDMTGKKKTLEELYKVKKQLESFVDDQMDSISITNTNGEIDYINQAYSEMFGFSKEEAVKLSNPIVPVWLKREEQCLVEQVKNGSKIRNIQTIRQQKSGELLNVSLSMSPIYNDFGQVIGISNICRDLTELEKNLYELRQAESELNLLWNHTMDAIFLVSHTGEILKANQSFKQLFQWSEKEVLPISSLYLDGQVNQLKAVQSKLHVEKEIVQFETKRKSKDGAILDVFATYKPIINNDNYTAFVTYRNITKEKEITFQLKESEEKSRKVIESLHDALVIHDGETITFINSAGLKLLKAKNITEVVGHSLLKFVHPQYKNIVEERIKKDFLKGNYDDLVEEIYHSLDGEQIYVETATSSIKKQGKTHFVVMIRDITQKRRAENILKESQERFRIIAEHTRSMIEILDVNGKIFYASPSLEDTLGYSVRDVLGSSFFFNLHHDDQRKVKDIFSEMRLNINTKALEIRHIHQDGYSIWLKSHFTPIFAKDGEIEKIIVISDDITETKQKEQKLKKMAYYDYLTGLPNRRLFTERLNQAIITSKKTGNITALLVLDCDKFKTINDTLGHEMGDEVIKEFAQRLKTNIWKKDTLSRVGGDEFTIVLPEIKESYEITEICKRIQESIEHPMFINGHEINITTSIGVACYPVDTECEEQLFNIADTNLYHSKKMGGNTFTIKVN